MLLLAVPFQWTASDCTPSWDHDDLLIAPYRRIRAVLRIARYTVCKVPTPKWLSALPHLDPWKFTDSIILCTTSRNSTEYTVKLASSTNPPCCLAKSDNTVHIQGLKEKRNIRGQIQTSKPRRVKTEYVKFH